ncbi:hypothetical protein CEXT_314371 [Caerostris extrusa]|uniref:Uncharacterized protein n=1 Tax=Caerostris extrusa TaxID=172846 RepID=A0AAV4REV4_CAEEX|nr:hypothetical protein CEXT_314371 [Caerostris extrusa]
MDASFKITKVNPVSRRQFSVKEACQPTSSSTHRISTWILFSQKSPPPKLPPFGRCISGPAEHTGNGF